MAKKGKYHQGFFKPKNKEKYFGDVENIVYRSSWEAKFMRWADKNNSVLQWGSEIFFIPYYSNIDGKVRRYFPDFWIKQKCSDGVIRKFIIEIKPNKEKYPPTEPKRKTKKALARYITETATFQRNQDKWKSAKEFAKKHNMRFIVMDEYALGIQKRPKNNG